MDPPPKKASGEGIVRVKEEEHGYETDDGVGKCLNDEAPEPEEVPSAGVKVEAEEFRYETDDGDDDTRKTSGTDNNNSAADMGNDGRDCNTVVKENVVNSATDTTEAEAPPTKNNDGNKQLTVCRFLVKHIQGGRGYATSDYHIDLIKERHGLYDLVSTVYDILQRESLTSDRITSHLWDVTFAGKRYHNGWRRQQFPGEGAWDRPAKDNEVDEGERRILSALVNHLERGQKGVFSGQSVKVSVHMKLYFYSFLCVASAHSGAV